MARTLLGEIFEQITGVRRKRKHHSHHERPNRQVEKILYETKKAIFENKKAYEIAQLRAKSKGWIK